MAIIQISKIQQRSGNLVDLPQLDEAQFGWASDAKRLFIGKTTPNENIEVLTSYSNISFSQVDGSGGTNFNVTTPVNGQTLTYVSSTNTWDNWTGNSALLNGSKLQLGNVANISMIGGSTGFVLQTDGLGNLSWTPKTTIVANIVALSNATPIVMTINANIPYTNGTQITISGVSGSNSGANSNANTIVNSHTFYVKLANDFPSSGNVSLYLDSGLTSNSTGTGLSYTNSPNALAITTVGGTSTLVAAGTDTSIQFNNGGTLQGSPYFNILNGNGLLTHTGPYFTVGNVYANSGTVGASLLTGTLTTNAQPNVTSVGVLTSVSVSGNANIGNIGTSGLITATGNVRGGNLTTSGALSVTGNANVGNIGATFGVFTNVSGNGSTLSSITGANVTGAVSYATTANAVAGANVSGTVGLATYAITANAVAGANVSGAVSFATTANAVAGANVSGTVGLATYATTANAVAGANVSGTVANATYATSAGTATSATTAGTVTTAAQPNITSTGTLASLTVTANVATAGIKTDNYYYANGVSISFAGSYSNSNVAAYLPTFTGTVGATVLTTGANTTAGTITGNWSLSAGSKLNSTYADLAEYYESDSEYESGTVLEFGGEKEVTLAKDGTTRVAGVVSTNPAYAMNANCQGVAVAIALQGRVPTKVRGAVHKGDMMVSAGNGFARTWNNPAMGTVIGKALENFDGIEGVIEVAVGRL